MALLVLALASFRLWLVSISVEGSLPEIALSGASLKALYVGSTLKLSLEQHHDVISTTFQRCSNVRCPLGSKLASTYFSLFIGVHVSYIEFK